MPLFRYQALTFAGEPREGREFAASPDALREALAGRDLILKRARPMREDAASGGGRVPLKELAGFNRQFTVLLRAGITIPQALGILKDRPGQPRMEAALGLLLDEIGRGSSLSDAIERQGGAFEPSYRAVVATGERAGALAMGLERYQSFLDLRLTMRAKTSKAMVYPAILLLTLVVVVAFLFVAVIPNFVAMYEELGSELPGPTRVLMGVAENVHWIGGGLASLVAALVFGDRAWSVSGGEGRDRFLLDLPVLGPLRRAEASAQTTRILSTLIESGTPASEALRVTSSSVADRSYAAGLREADRALHEGRSVTQALDGRDLLPPESMRMLVAGEASGRLAAMLGNVAAYHESELEDRLTRTTAFAEPVLILTAGLVVGAIIVAMYLPVFSMTELIQ